MQGSELQATFSILKPSGSTYSAPAPFAEALQTLAADRPLNGTLLRSCLHSHTRWVLVSPFF